MQEEHTYIGNSKLRCPSTNFNALFLLKHAQGHFIKEGIRMRHVLDWSLFLGAKQEKVDWARMLPLLEKTRKAKFAGVMTVIAIRHLHIDVHNKRFVGFSGKCRTEVGGDCIVRHHGRAASNLCGWLVAQD